MSEQDFIERWRRWKTTRRQDLLVGDRVLLITSEAAISIPYVVPIHSGAYPGKFALVESGTGGIFFSLGPPQIGQPVFLLQLPTDDGGDDAADKDVVALSPLPRPYCESDVVHLEVVTTGLALADGFKRNGGGHEKTFTRKWHSSHVYPTPESQAELARFREEKDAWFASARGELEAARKAMAECRPTEESYNDALQADTQQAWLHLNSGHETEVHSFERVFDRKGCSYLVYIEGDYPSASLGRVNYSGLNLGTVRIYEKDFGPEDPKHGDIYWETWAVQPWEIECDFTISRRPSVLKTAYVYSYCIPEPDKVKRIMFEICFEGKPLAERPDIHFHLGHGVVDAKRLTLPYPEANDLAERIAGIEAGGITGRVEEDTLLLPAKLSENRKDVRRVVVAFDSLQYNMHYEPSRASREDFDGDDKDEALIQCNERMGIFSIVITGEPLVDLGCEAMPSLDKHVFSPVHTVSLFGGKPYLAGVTAVRDDVRETLTYPLMIPLYAISDASVEEADLEEEEPEQEEENTEGGDDIGEE